MDLYEDKEHIISSDEYTDDDDDENDALMNDAVTAQDHNVRSSSYNGRSKQPKWIIDQKQKQLSSLIRRNKISVIYKNKSIKWLNNKWQRERYKVQIYSYAKNSTTGQMNSATEAPLEQEKYENPAKAPHDQKYDTVNVEDFNNDVIFNKSKIEEITEGTPLSSGTFYCSTIVTNVQPEKVRQIVDENTTIQEGTNLEKLTAPIEKTEEFPRKRTRLSSSPNLNKSDEICVKHNDKKHRAESPQFYKSINDMFPKFDKIVTNHISTIANSLLTDVEDKIKNLSNEIDTLNEILQAKEKEWHRLSHLKMVKEEIHSRLNKKKHILQLKQDFSNKQDQNILLELKELELYLSENKTAPETKHSTMTIQKLIENRANMNAEDLRREKNNTSRLHSLLVSQNMLHATESLENTCVISNGEKTDLGSTSNSGEICNQLEGERLANNRGRQGEVRDVRSLIADFRQKNPELLPRVGKRIKSTESNVLRQGYNIPLLEKTSRSQYFTKDQQTELYSLPNSVDEISITPIARSKKLSSSHDMDFNAMSNHYNVRLDDTVLKSQPRESYNGKCPRNIQYPLCQECKVKESRFVCAGCGKQWYCSKKCQISAWDRHSELCTE